MSKKEIFELASKIISLIGKAERYAPYNVFTAWKMSENDHTKILLAQLLLVRNMEQVFTPSIRSMIIRISWKGS